MIKKFVILASLVFLAACGVVSPDNGQQAVLISKPWIIGHGGVQNTPILPGRTFTAVTTDAVYIDMLPENWTMDFDDIMSSDGVPLTFHAALRVQVVDSVKLYKGFGEQWFLNNLSNEWQTAVRQAVRKRGMNETAIGSSAIPAIDAEVFNELTAYVKRANLPVKIIAANVGKANPPRAIKDQRIQTAQQQQRQLTMIEMEKAEKSRLGAESARAQADNAYRVDMNLTPDQFLRLETIKMQEVACQHGTCIFSDGRTPVLIGSK